MKMAKLRIRCKPEYIHLFGKEPETLAETERSLRSAEVIHGFLKKRDKEEKQKLMQQFQPLIDEVKHLKENQVEETLAVIG